MSLVDYGARGVPNLYLEAPLADQQREDRVQAPGTPLTSTTPPTTSSRRSSSPRWTCPSSASRRPDRDASPRRDSDHHPVLLRLSLRVRRRTSRVSTRRGRRSSSSGTPRRAESTAPRAVVHGRGPGCEAGPDPRRKEPGAISSRAGDGHRLLTRRPGTNPSSTGSISSAPAVSGTIPPSGGAELSLEVSEGERGAAGGKSSLTAPGFDDERRRRSGHSSARTCMDNSGFRRASSVCSPERWRRSVSCGKSLSSRTAGATLVSAAPSLGDLRRLVLAWLPGQDTDWHDHGGSSGSFCVADGVLLEQLRTGGGHRVRTPPAVGERADLLRSRRTSTTSVIHGSAPAVSIHAYSPPLVTMTYYELTPRGLVANETVVVTLAGRARVGSSVGVELSRASTICWPTPASRSNDSIPKPLIGLWPPERRW